MRCPCHRLSLHSVRVGITVTATALEQPPCELCSVRCQLTPSLSVVCVTRAVGTPPYPHLSVVYHAVWSVQQDQLFRQLSPLNKRSQEFVIQY
jgi:hypothetical protein